MTAASCRCAAQKLLTALANKGVWAADVPVELRRKLHSSCLGLTGIVHSQIVYMNVPFFTKHKGLMGSEFDRCTEPC